MAEPAVAQPPTTPPPESGAGAAHAPGAAGAPVCIDLGIFAHDEGQRIAGLLESLAGQDIWGQGDIDLRALVLANGCRDDTVGRARAAVAMMPSAVASRVAVLDLPQGGKSRTGHRFIHELSRPTAEILCCMDADIRLPRPDLLRRMAAALRDRPGLRVFNSRPVKDTVHDPQALGLVARLISAGGGGLDDWRTAICGQLFMIRTEAARRIGLPAGLPVEDGFMRAMVLTDLLTGPEDLSRIDGDPELFHVYDSIRGLRELLRHQTRLVIGSAVNAALFARIRDEARDEPEAHALLMAAAADEGWIAATLRAQLPRRPFGYVPFQFLTKRLLRYRQQGGPGLKPAAVAMAGSAMDAVVWLRASWQMRRGAGAGHW